MLVNLSNIFTRDETEKQLAQSLISLPKMSVMMQPLKNPLPQGWILKKALTKHLLSLLYRQQLYVPAPDVLNCLKDNLISHEIL